jgi:hypothetical protein
MKTRGTNRDRNVLLFEDFDTNLDLFVVELNTSELKWFSHEGAIQLYNYYVFADEADAEAMCEELLEKNPNIDVTRAEATLDFIDTGLPDYIDPDSLEYLNVNEIYNLLNRVDREEVDKGAIKLAHEYGKRFNDPIYHYYEVYYDLRSMREMIEIVDSVYRKEGRIGVDKQFANLDWMPKDVLARFRRESKTKRLFGV